MAYVVKLKESELLASNIPENLFKGDVIAVYAAGTYAVDSVLYDDSQTIHRVYKSRIDNNNISSVSDLLDETKWQDMGATDRYALVDQYKSSQSSYAEEIQVDIDSGMTDTVGFFGLQANEITLELFHNDISVKAETFSLMRQPEASYYAYQCHFIEYKKSFLWRYPFYSTSKLRATIKWLPGESAKCGIMAAGLLYDIGGTLRNPSIGVGINSKSRIVDDDYGDVTFVPRKRKRENTASLWFPTSELLSIYYLMEDLDATPAIFNLNNTGDNEIFMTYGYYSPWKVDVPGDDYCRATTTIREIG